MMDILKSIILGFIEGVTEWLPISSTGHLKLAGEFLIFNGKNVGENFQSMFDYVIQIGAILAVVVIFWNKLWPFTSKEKGIIKRKSMMIWSKVIVAVIPAIIAGVLAKVLDLDKYLDNSYVISGMLILYGVLFIVIERINRNRKPAIISMKALTYKDAFLIGLFQALSVVPGTSRSGVTILGAIILGASRTVATEFSFFMAVPVICGAGLLEIIDHGFDISGVELVILAVGLVTAFVVSIIAIKFLLGYIKKKDFTVFGYYRIILGLLVLGYFLAVAQ